LQTVPHQLGLAIFFLYIRSLKFTNRQTVRKGIYIFISLSAIASIFFSFGLQDSERRERMLLSAVTEIISTYHFQPTSINDSQSERVFNLFIKRLDFSKMHFLQSDITALETYKYLIDDEIKARTFNFFELANEIISKRTEESARISDSLLQLPFNLYLGGYVELSEDKRGFQPDYATKVALWRQILKSQVMGRVYELEKQQSATDSIPSKPIDSLETEAREYVRKKYESRFKRSLQLTRDDRLGIYINCVTNEIDPHTGYFPPKDKENFDINISGKLEGIGATLSERDGTIRVTDIVPGSASWRQGELQPEDIILKVGQAEDEAVDVVGMRLDEAVRLIRGPKGSLVKLTVRKLDGSTAIIPIIRDIVIIEDTYAKSAVIRDGNYKRDIGYIYLPKFYIDFNNPQGRRAATDVLKEIEKLKAAGVEGLILDLRDNGGGSLSDVVTIGGYFIEEGPIVQVKSRYVTPKILADTDKSVQYPGPLLIMVNSFSASASEILAAAMQDYQRAIIVGSASTYGKGTVQRFLEIDNFLTKENKSLGPMGDLKITIQKFYRINGGATQLRGVQPDIVIPDRFKFIERGESDHDYPIEWDEIPAVPFKRWTNPVDLKKIRKANEKLLQNDTIFKMTVQLANTLKERQDDTKMPLDYEKFTAKQKNFEPSEREKNIGKAETGLTSIQENMAASDDTRLDSVKQAGADRWHIDISKDIELYHSYKLLNESM
jgi:carboxyl-terminal processing protease